MNKRRGFTLIEVMVALSILMVVILALLGNYYSYYDSVKQAMYKNVGQNLAELLLEDTRNLSVTILDSLVKGGQYPTEILWDKYIHSTSHEGCYEVTTGTPASDIPDGIPFPVDQYDDDDSENTPYDAKYDSGEVDATYRLQKVSSVFGIENSPDIICDSLNNLPGNVVITPVYYSDEGTFDYTVLLNKTTYPYYTRQIVIRDLTPDLLQITQKIYEIEVTVYWTVGGSIDPSTGEIVGGTKKSVTLKGEKSFRQ